MEGTTGGRKRTGERGSSRHLPTESVEGVAGSASSSSPQPRSLNDDNHVPAAMLGDRRGGRLPARSRAGRTFYDDLRELDEAIIRARLGPWVYGAAAVLLIVGALFLVHVLSDR